MSSLYEPTAAKGGPVDGAAGARADVAPSGGMSGYAEGQLTSQTTDISAASQYFTPTGAEAHLPAVSVGGHEALAAKAVAAMPGMLPGAEAGMAALPGAESAIGALVPGSAEAAISPVIQLIMRLPGMLGVGQSFFELLAVFFMPGKLMEAFNPLLWAGQIKSTLATAATAGGEHFAIPLSLLPANAPIWQQLAMMNGQMPVDFKAFQAMTPQTSLSNTISLRDHLNVSGTLDLKKIQFEGVPQSTSQAVGSSLRHEGILSGPSLNPNLQASHLAGAKRLFSDKIASPTLAAAPNNMAQSTFLSQAQVPANSSSLNVGATSFTQEPVVMQTSEGTLSGTSMSSSDIGYQLSGSHASVDSTQSLAPSGAVSDRLGGQQLIAQAERPLSGGYYSQPESAIPVSPDVSRAATSTPLTGLKAPEALSLKKAVAPGAHSKQVVDHVGHQTKGATSHSSTGSSAGNKAVDQVSHKHTPKVSHSSHHTSHAPKAASAPKNVERAPEPVQKPVETAQSPEAATDANVEATDYTVHKGDNLWDIAKNKLGDGSKWQEIYKLNQDAIGSNPDLIHTGAHLKLPGTDGGVATANAGHHVVQPGDNLWDIARKELGDGSRWGEIYKANADVIGGNPRLISPGQDLMMPGQDATSISQATPVDPAAAAQPTAMAPAQPAIDPQMAQPAAQPTYGAPTQAYGAPMQGYVQPAGVPTTGYAPAGSGPIMQDYQGMLPNNRSMPIGPGAVVAATPEAAAANQVVNSSLGADLSALLDSTKK